MSLMITVPVGIALIVLGLVYLKIGRDQKRYFERATEAGTDPGKLDDVYYVYSVNKSLVGNLAIWLGVGLLIASVMLLLV
jgi:hypothetical protein